MTKLAMLPTTLLVIQLPTRVIARRNCGTVPARVTLKSS
jgi:hypothetical protein